MARVELDHEDLMKEAVALVRRMECAIDAQTVLVGFRSTRWLSIYFNTDPMYQFDELGRLRRAFVDGLLYRTQGNVLAQLERQRTQAETILVRRDLSTDRLASFQQQAFERLRWLSGHLQTGSFRLNSRCPENDENLLSDVLGQIETILNASQFLAPAIKR